MAASDRRRHPRKLVDLAVLVQVREGARFPARLGQMSIGGSFIDTTERPPLGTELTLLFRLPDGPTEFVVSAIVRWSAPTGVGVQFGAMRAREIYELSRFLVDKTTLPPPAPVPRSPVRAALPTRPRLPRLEQVPTSPPAPAAEAAPEENRTAKPPPSDDAPAETEVAKLQSQVRLLDAVLAERDVQLRKATADRPDPQRVRALETTVSERDEQVRALETTVSERDERIRALETTVGERDERVRALERTVGERSEQVRALETTVSERDERIRALEVACAEALTSREEQQGDDLTRLRGVGPAFARILHQHGVRRFGQIASWTQADVERMAGELKVPAARILRSDWPGHAAALLAERDATPPAASPTPPAPKGD